MSDTVAVWRVYSPRWLMSDYIKRWLVVAIVVLFDVIALPSADIHANWQAALPQFELAVVVMAYAVAFSQFGRFSKKLPTVARFGEVVSDFGFSVVQLMTFVTFLVPLTYVLARTDFPLIDDQLRSVDSLLGFDWSSMRSWVVSHPAVHALLQFSYFSAALQPLALFAIGSVLEPGKRTGELIWLMIVSPLICCVVFALIPSYAMGGEVSSYVSMLHSLRADGPLAIDFSRLIGIIQFPSFHASAGVIYIYAARHRLWTLLPFAALNTAMIAATPPIGGHYLTDTIGGIGVALVTIAAIRRLHPASPSASDSRLALPPAAVVSTDTTRSDANRAR